MSKLIFETDDKVQHALDIKSVSTKSLNKTDVLMIDCEVGKETSPKEANVYMVDLRDAIQAYFPDNKIIVTAMRDGVKDIELKIVKDIKG